MFRKQLTLALFATLLLTANASAQTTQQGEGDVTGGTGSGNVQSGSGQVAPAPTRAPSRRVAPPRPTATPFRAAPTPVPTPAVTRARPTTTAPARRPAPAKPKPKARKPASTAGLAGGLSAKEANCLSPLERAILRRRAKGRSVTAIGAELDMAAGAVSAAEHRGLRRLLVRGDPDRCAKAGDGKSSASSKKRRVSQTVAAAKKPAGSSKPRPASPSTPDDGPLSAATILPKDDGSGGLLLLVLGILALLIVGMTIHVRGPMLALMWRERTIERGPFRRRYAFERRNAFKQREPLRDRLRFWRR